MRTRYTWIETKRAKNLAKHGLDFVDAGMVLDNPYRLDGPSVRNDEAREQSFAFVFERLAGSDGGAFARRAATYHQLSPGKPGRTGGIP